MIFLKGASKKLIDDNEDLRRAVIVELFSSVIKDTPVDEGRAQGNWQTSHTVARYEEVAGAKSGAAALDDVKSTVNSSIDKDLFLSNNVPYINRLEYDGWSDQAPRGMVRKNMARVSRNIRKHQL